MREDALRAYLAPRLGADSVRSYVAYAHRAEAVLDLDLDAADLSHPGRAAIADRLRRAALPAASVRNIGSALRHYGR